MNQRKLIKGALIVTLFIYRIVPVFASPPAPTPLCRIEGKIESVDFKDAYNEPCLSQPYGCPTDTEVSHPARYYLTVNINAVSYFSGSTDFNTCESLYSVGSAKTISIDKEKVKPEEKLAATKKIAGIVRSSGRSFFDSYNLTSEPGMDKLVTRAPPIFSSPTMLVGLLLLGIALVTVTFKIISQRNKLS